MLKTSGLYKEKTSCLLRKYLTFIHILQTELYYEEMKNISCLFIRLSQERIMQRNNFLSLKQFTTYFLLYFVLQFINFSDEESA